MQIVKEAVELHIPYLPTVILMSLLVWGILFILSIIAVRKISIIPKGIQNFLEMTFEWILNFADNVIGPEAGKYYPLFLGIFLFIFTANILGVIPGLNSPTANPNIPLSLALAVFFYYHIQGFIKHKLGYIKNFIIPGLPLWMMPVNILIFFIEFISHLVRPFSLSLRLFCNIFAKETLLGCLAFLAVSIYALPGIGKFISLMPVFLRPMIILLAILIGFVQALIFLLLSIIYVGGAVKSEH
ncbi:MAG: F0F1 ATP synthase subunit A [Elusimicrobia bacterium]|nr:F0F1 ATP synthase subunit A [Elusimicrobiota bacterium]